MGPLGDFGYYGSVRQGGSSEVFPSAPIAHWSLKSWPDLEEPIDFNDSAGLFRPELFASSEIRINIS